MNYQAPENLLKNKTILITGAGDGLGKAAAKTYAKHGATVILLGRTTHKLESVYDEIVANGSVTPAIYPLNLEGATPKDYQDLANTIKEEFGHLNGLLHSAALMGNNSPIQQYDVELWYKTMQVNLNAPFLLTQAVLPLMRESKDASIVFTIDDKTTAYWGAYGISKGAITHLMKILADEIDSENPVKVNAINPGPVRTGLRMKAFPGEDPQLLKLPDEVMGSYLFLMGGDCSETGQVFDAQ